MYNIHLQELAAFVLFTFFVDFNKSMSKPIIS